MQKMHCFNYFSYREPPTRQRRQRQLDAFSGADEPQPKRVKLAEEPDRTASQSTAHSSAFYKNLILNAVRKGLLTPEAHHHPPSSARKQRRKPNGDNIVDESGEEERFQDDGLSYG